MRRIPLFAILLLATFVAVLGTSQSAYASAPYTWEYNATNLYTNDVIFYEFSGLDSSRSYGWTIYSVDMQTGLVKDRLGYKVLGPGVTTGNWAFGYGTTDIGYWPSDYVGPVYVVDQFGFTLGKHFVMPPVLQQDGSDVWEASGGVFTYNQKVVIGNYNGNINDGCKSVVYNDINPNGHHHGFFPCQSTTTIGDIAVLHFQFDPIGYASPTNDYIRVISLDEGSGSTNVLQISQDDIHLYQVTPGSSGGATYTSFNSFILINTGETELPYVDYERADAAFGTASNANPMRWGKAGGLSSVTDIRGAYGCFRVNNLFTVVADCESVWLVSDDPTVNQYNDTEWSISLLDNVSEAGTQVVTLRQATQDIWDSYHGAMTLTDTYSGFSDLNIYAFAPRRTTSYTVNNTASQFVDVQASYDPRFVASNNIDVIPSDYRFYTSKLFDITTVITFEENVEIVMQNLGLDSELGRTMLHGVILMLSLVFTAFVPVAREKLLSYLAAWTASGGVFVIAGFASDFGALVFSIITLFMWIVGFTVFREALTGSSGSSGVSQNG